MFYYRFRSSSELSIKELMYNEIYFASTKECNDPFEGKAFLTFNADKDKWKRLIELAWKNYINPNKAMWEEHLSEYLVLMGALTYDAVLRIDYAQILQSFDFPPDTIIADMLAKLIIHFLNLYYPKDMYFSSFSHKNNNMLMWSHYASMHQGYCLIFKAVDNMLYQHPKCRKHSISRDSITYSIPEGFCFQDVTYSLDTTQKDAFYCFPQHVLGEKVTEEELEDIIARPSQQYLRKHVCWDYEKESRLLLSSPSAWINGSRVECSQQERLFHYHPNQLVGIILGARMDIKQRLRIREIIKERMDRIGSNVEIDFPIFDFVLFQAMLPDNQREVIIKEEEIFTLTGTIDKNNNNFQQHLQNWKEGFAIVFSNNGSCGTRKKF